MKHFQKQKIEKIVGVSMLLTDLQSDGSCDCCNKELPSGVRVVGKTISLESFGATATRFSPTCLECAGLN